MKQKPSMEILRDNLFKEEEKEPRGIGETTEIERHLMRSSSDIIRRSEYMYDEDTLLP